MSVIPAELRADPQVASGRTVRELALAGRVTVGLAGFGVVTGGGLAVAGVASQPVALAVTRLERRGDRVWGVPCRGVVAVQAEIRTGYTVGAGAGSMARLVNPFALDTVRVRVSGSQDASGGWQWWPDAESERTPWKKPVWSVPPKRIANNSRSGGNYYIVDEVWEVPRGALFALSGGLYGVTMTLIFDVPGGVYNWRRAVAALAWAASGAGAPWWGSIAATARAGSWVRRVSWEDWARRVRYVAGAGTARAVAVDQSGAVLTPESFGAAEYLATDWQVVGTAEPMPVDVTDWVFSGPPDAVAWAVEGSATPGENTGPESPSDGVDGVPPSSGDYVRMSRDGVAQWVPVQMFACPVE